MVSGTGSNPADDMWVDIIGAMVLIYLPIIEPFLITRHLTIIVLLPIIILNTGKTGKDINVLAS